MSDLYEQIRTIYAELGDNVTIAEVARQAGCSRDSVYKAIGTARYVTGGPALDDLIVKEDGDERDVTFTSVKPVKTLEDLIKAAEIDVKTWRVKSWISGAWNVAVKIQGGFDEAGRRKPDTSEVKQLFKVTAKLERVLPQPYLEAIEGLYARFTSRKPTPVLSPRVPASRPCMLELDLFDVHIGKLAWAPETGENYDLRLAEKVFADAVEDLLEHARGRDVELILFPFGNDFFHIDGPNNATTAGTPQDVDGRFAKLIEVGSEAVARAIERAREVADVKVLRVPGNHDRISSLHLLNYLSAYFRNTPGVEVSRDKSDRQFVAYGSSLIGFTHGNEERVSSLPMIMATERGDLWSASRYREWHLGHYHKSKSVQFTNVDTETGVVLRYLQSLSGRDAWHYRRGYVGGRRAAEAMLFDKSDGLVANYHAVLRSA